MPTCIDAERALLGALLIDAERAFKEIAEDAPGLRTADFWVPQHRAIWAAMLRLRDESTFIDPITIVDMLKQMGFLETVDDLTAPWGGTEPYLVECFGDVWAVAGCSAHAGMVHRYAESRRMIQQGLTLVETGQTVRTPVRGKFGVPLE